MKIIHKKMETIRKPKKNYAGEASISRAHLRRINCEFPTRRDEFHPPPALKQTISKRNTIFEFTRESKNETLIVQNWRRVRDVRAASIDERSDPRGCQV